ncbi:ATP-binding protein [Curtobacterium sp. NPDC098951]|uniref:ATP-binding protein n=1 Tax=Curtobacterium sp. NPDC098951 TaxID=3363974 RepID=UPI003814628C
MTMDFRDEDRPWLSLLTDEDRWFMQQATSGDEIDPGLRTAAELQLMSPVERMLYAQDRADWHAALPLLQTTPVREALRRLQASGNAAASRREHRIHNSFVVPGGSSQHQESVMVLDGPAGVGKSTTMRAYIAREMERYAQLRYYNMLRGRGQPLDNPDFVFRPCMYVSLRASATRVDIERQLCAQYGWPHPTNAGYMLNRLLAIAGTQIIGLDEIQFIGFAGAMGRQVHNLIRDLGNQGVRVILGGNELDWVLQEQLGMVADQSRGRWRRIDITRLPYRTKPDKEEWRHVLESVEDHLRLVNQDEPGWLSEELAEYAWGASIGGFRSLTTLIRVAAASAIDDGSERVTRRTLDEVEVEMTAQDGREERMATMAKLRDRSRMPVEE